jgi:hypothetical protein
MQYNVCSKVLQLQVISYLRFTWDRLDTPTPQLLLNHAIFQLELCPGIQFADGAVWKDRDVGNMAFPIIVDRICRE